jgi:hypothetical protein
VDGLKQFDLLVSNRFTLQRGRRFHRDQGEEHKHMVLHHVTKCARCFVECSPPLDADGLGNDQLHMIDIAPVPHRFENRVANAKNQQILGCLLSEVVSGYLHKLRRKLAGLMKIKLPESCFRNSYATYGLTFRPLAGSAILHDSLDSRVVAPIRQRRPIGTTPRKTFPAGRYGRVPL